MALLTAPGSRDRLSTDSGTELIVGVSKLEVLEGTVVAGELAASLPSSLVSAEAGFT